MEKVNIGVVGCGNISGIYFQNLTTVFLNTNVYACADLDEARAKEAAEKYGIPHIMTLDEMLSCPEIQIILNLTTPQSHYPICKKALEAGKHVYTEKPLSLHFDEGKELVRLAEKKGLLIGCAPDTFLGAGIQTCRKLIDSGFIGDLVGAAAFMLCPGHESWHPDPEFYYKTGGGPMFDMGPYYLTALVNLMGGAEEVCGMGSITFPNRTITSEKKFGTKMAVETDTHISGMIRFENGAIGTITTSFDVTKTSLPRIELYGTRGTLLVPDPNTFGGPVLLATKDGSGFREVPLTHNYSENSRGLGVSDMAKCILSGGENKASGALALHVLEMMEFFKTSDTQKLYHKMESRYEKTPPMCANVIQGEV